MLSKDDVAQGAAALSDRCIRLQTGQFFRWVELGLEKSIAGSRKGLEPAKRRQIKNSSRYSP